jgi:hypothetical protein
MNKEITLIDLLDMNAKGEKMPSKIKFEDNIYKLTDYGYEAENGDELYGLINFDGSNLNSTIEIIEDNDKLEKIEIMGEKIKTFYDGDTHFVGTNSKDRHFYIPILNKIIDHINKIEEKLDEK